ncbi:MAG: S1 RNA-binding domain-containing protein [Butyrivibrio sp.]|jgi:predicted RNA-binding protein (virulence factor B family)|nr:S1-like domain-containing RNA-binding protein [Butyrivibrio sp.]MBQ1457376.1 S1 RNA-binding domain-containing protein [Butyrivibrio sp.]MCR4636086.1 S1 RNA-binding domain-containing protein [Butyrivibrio sp.]
MKEMFNLGEKQTLVVTKKVDFGIYLAEEGTDGSERVLLPKKQVPKDVKLGDKLEVFLYKDSDDRLISTITEPKLMLHQVGRLTVTDVGKIGAFMDWGLEKDVLLPFHEQTRRVRKGEEVLCALYIDKSSRLCVTMNVYEYLSTDSPYKKDDRVTGVVYEMSDNFGAFVAIDDKYSALIPKKELYGDIQIGDIVGARVISVRDDGKLTLSIREKTLEQMDIDAKKILEEIDAYNGVLPFTDKASPDIIRDKISMSKNEFKRAVGRLLKEGKIEIFERGIRKTDKAD